MIQTLAKPSEFLVEFNDPLNVSAAQQEGHGECRFTNDCDKYRDCVNIQVIHRIGQIKLLGQFFSKDAGCVCNLGQCIYDGNPFREFGTECSDYKDCVCK